VLCAGVVCFLGGAFFFFFFFFFFYIAFFPYDCS